jgi:hypothetical protein
MLVRTEKQWSWSGSTSCGVRELGYGTIEPTGFKQNWKQPYTMEGWISLLSRSFIPDATVLGFGIMPQLNNNLSIP